MPLVSVVLTTYNRGPILSRTVRSLLSQTFDDFELIICDDASPDRTSDVVQDYSRLDHRIVYQRNTHNIGMPENLNCGIRRSSGTYVANVHDDDIYHPSLLRRWVNALEENPNAAFVFNQYGVLDAQDQVRTIYTENLPSVFSGQQLLEQIYFRRWRFDSPVWGTVMARRALYIEAGLFDRRFGFLADVDMWMRLAEKYDVAYVAEPLIALSSRALVPRQWSVDETGTLEQMFWEARMRHYRKRPSRRAVETLKHL